MKIRHLLGIIIVIAAIVPSLTISLVLLDRQYKATEQSMQQELNRVLDGMTKDIEYKFSIFSTNFKLFSSERILVQALNSFLLVTNAYQAMERFVKQTPLVKSIYLLDNNIQIIEEYNGSIRGFETSDLPVRIQEAIQEQKIQDGFQQMLMFRNPGIVKGVQEDVSNRMPSRYGVAIITPLYLHVLQEGLTREPEGYLLAIVPFHELYNVIAPQLEQEESVKLLHEGLVLIETPDSDKLQVLPSDLLLTAKDAFLGSEYTDSQLNYSVLLQVSQSARMSQLEESLNTLTLGISLAIAISVLAAIIVVHWLGIPFIHLSSTLKNFGRGEYTMSEQRLKFHEFEAVRQLLNEMASTIHEQLSSLQNKNIELQQMGELKDEYLNKVRALNEQLEQRVEEKTRELRDTLSREEHNREILESLLTLSIELQQCDTSNDVINLCLKQLPNLYPGCPLAIYLGESRNQSRSFDCIDMEKQEENWLRDELAVYESRNSPNLPKMLELHNGHYFLFGLNSVTHGFLGVLVLKASIISKEEQDIFTLFAKQASAIIETTQLTHELEIMARTDGLTGLPNRKAFDEAFEKEKYTLERYPEKHIAIFIIDANGLKFINDRFGHASGDRLIQSISEILLKVCRKSDQLFRLGGDEFALIVKQGSIEGCEQLMERLNNLKSLHYLKVRDSNDIDQDIQISYSVGYASSEEFGISSLFHNADQKMYAQKQDYYRLKNVLNTPK